MVNARDELTLGLPPLPGAAPVEWRISEGRVGYQAAVSFMQARAAAIAAGRESELVWLIEHPPLYTAGTSARPEDLIEARFPVFESGRGGQTTYHGPGQRVAYVMLDLKRRGPDLRRYVATLEEWIIRTLAAFNVRGERREDRIGVWVRRPDKGEGFEDKIAAIGIRVSHWVTLHGMALNVAPDLSHFAGIVPCGVRDSRYGVTSLADLGIPVSMPEVDQVLRREFEGLFGPTAQADGSTENTSPGRRGLKSLASPVALIQVIDARAVGPAPAGRDHVGDHRLLALEHGLDRALAPVAHPAFEPARKRLVFDKGAEADALHAAMHDDVADDAHASSPTSMTRAPVKRDIDQRSTPRI